MTVLGSPGSFVVVVGLLALTPGMDTALILRPAAGAAVPVSGTRGRQGYRTACGASTAAQRRLR